MISVELQDKLSAFNQKYSVNFDIERKVNMEKKNAILDEALLDKPRAKNANAKSYLSIMKRVLLDSLTAKTKISEQGKYNLEDFDFVNFMNEFEALMAQMNAESKDPAPRKPFENMNFDTLLGQVRDIANPFNQTVYGIWADKIINTNDRFSYKDLQAITDRAIQAIEASVSNMDVAYEHKDLVNIVYAKEAMARVRESRTGWWKFWHLYDNYKEAQYFEALSKQVEDYTERRFSVQKVLEEAPREILKTAYRKSAPASERELDIEVEKIKEIQEKNRRLSDVHEKMERVIANPNTTNELVEDIVKALPKGGAAEGFQRNIVKNHILPEMFKKVQECNREFDEAIASRTMTANVQMLYLVEAVFDKTFSMPGTLGYTSDKDMIVVAQAITDAVLKKLSPVALNSEELGMFANGYVVNNPNAYTNITGFTGTDEAMIEAKNDYNKLSADRVQVIEVLNENNVPIAPPVGENPPATNPPHLGNK